MAADLCGYKSALVASFKIKYSFEFLCQVKRYLLSFTFCIISWLVFIGSDTARIGLPAGETGEKSQVSKRDRTNILKRKGSLIIYSEDG